MRRIATLGLALFLAGCAVTRGPQVPPVTRGPQVPLAIDESVTMFNDLCILMHEVVDVTADPVSGGLVLNDGTQVVDLKWPKGFTAWRSGEETEVTDATGNVVMRTGGRFEICPSEYLNGWVAGRVKPCPDCKLGFQLEQGPVRCTWRPSGTNEYHDRVMWHRLAEACGRYLATDQQVAVECPLQTRAWDDDEGLCRWQV